MSLNQKIIALVHARGVVSTRDVIRELGHLVPLSSALAAADSSLRTQRGSSAGYTAPRRACLGRKLRIRNYLRNLVREGRLRRLRRGVYGPPAPPESVE